MTIRRPAALGLLLVAPLAFCWPLVNPWSPAMIVPGDFTEEFFALHSFAVTELEAGRLPLWNPYALGGHPFLAEMQTALWYPPHVLFNALIVLQGRPLTLGELEWLVPVHLLVAGAGAYLLGRFCTRSIAGGTITGVAYGLSGYLTSFPMQQLSILEASAWLPFQWYALLRLADAVRHGVHVRRWLAWTALVTGWLALPGHAQTVLYAATASAVLAAWQVLRTGRSAAFGWKVASRLALVYLAAGFLAATITAAQYLPSAQLALRAVRRILPYAKAAGGFSLTDWRAIFLPTGPITSALTLGPVVLLLLVAGAVAGWRQGSRVWLLLLGIGWLLSLGGHGPLYPVFRALVPGYALFRDQERAVVLAALSAAVLAGFGARWLVTARSAPSASTGRPWWEAGLAVVTLALVSGAVAWTLQRLQEPAILALPFPPPAAVVPPFAVLGAGVLLLLLCRYRQALAPGSITVLLVLLCWASLTIFGWEGNLRPGHFSPYQADSALMTVQHDPLAARLDSQGLIPADAGYVLQVPMVRGMDELRPAALDRLHRQVSANRYRELLAVRWLIDWRPDRAVSSHGWLIPDGADKRGTRTQYLYRIPESRPLVTIVHNVWLLPPGADPYPVLAANDFAPLTHVLLDAPVPARPGGAPDQIHLLRNTPGHLAVQYTSTAPGVLVYCEMAYPGWVVRLDHRPARLLVADTLLQATAAPAGSHEVDFIFQPVIVWWGAAIAALGYGAVAFLLLTSRRPVASGAAAPRATAAPAPASPAVSSSGPSSPAPR